jgi:hypothetical protein
VGRGAAGPMFETVFFHNPFDKGKGATMELGNSFKYMFEIFRLQQDQTST